MIEYLIHRNTMTKEQKLNLQWLFKNILVVKEETRDDPAIHAIIGMISCQSLETIIAGTKLTSLKEMRQEQDEIPGGRHNNDFIDFRKIQILPTKEEFICEDFPYLPKMSSHRLLSEQQKCIAALLDRQFRLLREDMLGPAKECSIDDPRKQRRDVYKNVRLHRIHIGTTVRGKPSQQPSIIFNFQLNKWHPTIRKKMKQKEKEEYWERAKRTLPKDALVCLLRQNKNNKNKWESIRFGTINRREVKELAHPKFSEIGINFFLGRRLYKNP